MVIKSMNSKVSIVVVNYNGKKYYDDFLASVYRQDYDNYDVIIVDNMSSDGSVEYIKSIYSDAIVLQQEDNLGFGVACNIGAQYAIKNGAEYILFLNNDTIIENDLISILVKNSDNNTASTCKIYCGDFINRELWYSGGRIDFYSGRVNQKIFDDDMLDISTDIDFISGCCVMVHKDILEKYGFFDERFYLYYEDTDICMRWIQNGVILKYVPTTSLWHKVGGSSSSGDDTSCVTQYYVVRNRLLFAEKYKEHFKTSIYDIYREILEERNYLRGYNNVKYKYYVKGAFEDFIRKDYGKGHLGKQVIEEKYWLSDSFHETESNNGNYWNCVQDCLASFFVINSKKEYRIFEIHFELACDSDNGKEKIDVQIDGVSYGKYSFPSCVSLMIVVKPEETVKIDLLLKGKRIGISQLSDGTKAYYQFLNLKIVDKTYDGICFGRGFYDVDNDGESYWRWCSERESSLSFINNTEVDKVYEFEFEVIPYLSTEKGIFSMLIEGDVAVVPYEKMRTIRFVVSAHNVLKVPIKNNFVDGKVDNRCYRFRICNYRIKEIKKKYYVSNSFGELESDGSNEWRWSLSEKAEIIVINNTSKYQLYEAEFTISGNDELQDISVNIASNTFSIELNKKKTLRILLEPDSTQSIVINAKCRNIFGEERVFCLNNLIVKRIEDHYMLSNEFGAWEKFGENVWSWACNKVGSIELINNSMSEKVYNISFQIVPYNMSSDCFVVDIDGKISKYMAYEIVEKKILMSPNSKISVQVITTYSEALVEDRIICFSINKLSIDLVSDEIVFGEELYGLEGLDDNHWVWSKNHSAEILLQNMSEANVIKLLSFTPTGFEEGELTINNGDWKEVISFGEMCEIPIELLSGESKVIKFTTSNKSLEVDGRVLCFCMNDFKCKNIDTYIAYEANCYENETDGFDNWRWVSTGNTHIIVARREQPLEIQFYLLGSDADVGKKIHVYVDGKKIKEISFYENCVLRREAFSNCYIHKIELKSSIESFKVEGDDRKFAFRIVNLTIKDGSGID